MKARLVPVFFPNERTERFSAQLESLKQQLGSAAEILPEQPLGTELPDCEAVVFPEILGEAYRSAAAIKALKKPLLIITSEFATVSMWDWEICNFLKDKGIATITPYNLTEAKTICRILATKRRLATSKFLIFQDNPGEGFQPEIFKSFYWWEDECTRTIKERFGTDIERRSLKELGKKAAAISDSEAQNVWDSWNYQVEAAFTNQCGINAAKLYLALKNELDSNDIIGIGTNCLNESHYCNTTPCLAWNQLLEDRDLMWVCEGDTSSLATKYLLYNATGAPTFMTNIYPFLMGNAALKHERIPSFPEIVADPQNHILLAHCGYFGLLPRKFSTDFTVRRKALAIVDENAHVFDSRMQTGAVTVSKLNAQMNSLMSIRGDLLGYVQYKDSDVRNGGIMRVPDGQRFMDNVYSHHVIIMQGDQRQTLKLIGKIMDLQIEEF